MHDAKLYPILSVLIVLFIIGCQQPATKSPEFDAASKVENGKPAAVMLTAYSTTLLANGTDHTPLRIAVSDSIAREITSANNEIQIYVFGDGKITAPSGDSLVVKTDTAGLFYRVCKLNNGICNLVFTAGNFPGRIKVEAKSPGLWTGSHEIHTLPAEFVLMQPSKEQLPAPTKAIDRMIGADISWLPELEERGMKFYNEGNESDAIALLKSHGFNYIRLRLFVNPANEKGYSPGIGFCGLEHTLAMAKRVQEAGMKLLLNFHYSDYWADPQQQFVPLAWSELDYETLKDTLKNYTVKVINAFRDQGTLPAMVQVGNEINHGMLWPDGHISNPDQLAGLLKAGIDGVRMADPSMPVMIHIALGGQNQEAVFWLDNMTARGVEFDIIGLSYYPRWHGTLRDLDANLRDLAGRYHKPLNVVEYSNFKKEVHEIVFALPENLGKGACIWEPLNWWSGLFTRNGEVTDQMLVYDSLYKEYLLK